jgi:hypothetical protein
MTTCDSFVTGVVRPRRTTNPTSNPLKVVVPDAVEVPEDCSSPFVIDSNLCLVLSRRLSFFTPRQSALVVQSLAFRMLARFAFHLIAFW